MSIALNAGFANKIADNQSRPEATQKTTALPFRDYLPPTFAALPDTTSQESGTISGQATDLVPGDVVHGPDAAHNGFAQTMAQMLGMAQGSVNTAAADIAHTSIGSPAAEAKHMASPFQNSLTALGAHSAEKANKVSTQAAETRAAFDPFSVVRSGAVPESNAFVICLKRLFGLVVDESPVPENPAAAPVDAAPLAIENVQAQSVSQERPPTTDPLPEPVAGLSQLISDALEQSAVTTSNQELMDTVLHKLS